MRTISTTQDTPRARRACRRRALPVAAAGIAAIAVAALLLAGCAPKEKGEVVARVNGTAIYRSSLDMELLRFEGGLVDARKTEKEDPARFGRLKAGALEKLIDTELLYQESQRKGHKVPKEKVDAEISSIVGQFDSQEGFDKALAEMHLKRSDMARDIEHTLAIQEFVSQDIEGTIAVAPGEARAYYDQNPELFTQPERVRARHILIQVKPEASEEKKAETRKTLEGLRQRVLRGEDFAELAKQYSEGPSKDQGGDLGFFSQGQMVEPFEKAAFALKVGEVSGVVVSPFGYHLIQLVDRKPAKLLAFDQVEPQLVKYLRDTRTGEAVASLVRELRQKAEISLVEAKTAAD